ncbi:uncharacterized protein [Henckelia pumila]|uniref:uncharacterized protein n=1 Tax=Henckelia pumila TaxID=405737 RepID=UPI003C6E5D03
MEIDNQTVHTSPTLSFGPEDLKGVFSNHNDALVIRATVANYDVARIFVDSGHAIRPVGLVHLPLTLGRNNSHKTRIVSFIIVDAPFAYNAILGRPAMTTFMAVASALHQKMKFPVGNEVGEVRIEQKVARTDNVDRPGLSGMEKVNLIEDTFVTAEEEIEEIMILPPSGMVKIARNLEAQLKQLLLECLEKNKDVFAWSVSNLVGVHREVAEHKLNVIKGCCHIIQKKRHFGPEKDALVDSTAGHELLSFFDAYQGYHQISLAKEDKDKTLKNYQLKLNPSKCTFEVRAGKFLGYMVTRRGIESNPEKVQAIISMSSPKNIQEVQRLTGRITALARFISRSADKSLPFFKALRKTKDFEWSDESEKAFQDLKTYLKQLPVLNKPTQGEELFLYLAVTP